MSYILNALRKLEREKKRDPTRVDLSLFDRTIPTPARTGARWLQPLSLILFSIALLASALILGKKLEQGTSEPQPSIHETHPPRETMAEDEAALPSNDTFSATTRKGSRRFTNEQREEVEALTIGSDEEESSAWATRPQPESVPAGFQEEVQEEIFFDEHFLNGEYQEDEYTRIPIDPSPSLRKESDNTDAAGSNVAHVAQVAQVAQVTQVAHAGKSLPPEAPSPVDINAIVWSEEEARRFAMVNLKTVREGDSVMGLLVREIRKNSIIFIFRGEAFELAFKGQ